MLRESLNSFAPEISAPLFFILFFEGMFTFLSPCILPMFPVYLIYLNGSEKESNKKRLILNTIAFILGFSFVFVSLGAAASSVGSLINTNRPFLEKISGLIMILFGLNYIGIIKIDFMNTTKKIETKVTDLKFFSSFIFGLAFSFGLTPCISTHLGTAMLIASNSKTVFVGMLLLSIFSLGLGIPFIVLALLFDKLQNTFKFIKKHISAIKIVSGALMILIGILMFFNLFGYYMGLFNKIL